MGIFNYKGKNVLKKTDLDYKQEGEGTSHVYRMVLKPDNTVRVEIDEEKIYEGSIKEDWEVLAPKEIPDPEDKKPDDWSDESMIDDPEDKKPEDWVEEKRISNPAYKGFWEAKKIANPDYVDDDSVYKFDDFGFIGFDQWQVKGNTIFDNIIITDDVAEADSFAKKWKDLSAVEKAKKKEEDDAKKAEEDSKKTESKDKEEDDDDEEEEEKKESEAV